MVNAELRNSRGKPCFMLKPPPYADLAVKAKIGNPLTKQENHNSHIYPLPQWYHKS